MHTLRSASNHLSDWNMDKMEQDNGEKAKTTMHKPTVKNGDIATTEQKTVFRQRTKNAQRQRSRYADNSKAKQIMRHDSRIHPHFCRPRMLVQIVLI